MEWKPRSSGYERRLLDSTFLGIGVNIDYNIYAEIKHFNWFRLVR